MESDLAFCLKEGKDISDNKGGNKYRKRTLKFNRTSNNFSFKHNKMRITYINCLAGDR